MGLTHTVHITTCRYVPDVRIFKLMVLADYVPLHIPVQPREVGHLVHISI